MRRKDRVGGEEGEEGKGGKWSKGEIKITYELIKKNEELK